MGFWNLNFKSQLGFLHAQHKVESWWTRRIQNETNYGELLQESGILCFFFFKFT